MTSNGNNTAAFDQAVDSFTSLQESQALTGALLLFDHALQGGDNLEAIQKIQDKIPLPYFFQLLQADYDDQGLTMEMLCKVLVALLKPVLFSDIQQNPTLLGALQQALSSPLDPIHSLGISQIEKTVNEHDEVAEALFASDIFSGLIDGLQSDNIGAAERSKRAILKITDTRPRLDALVSNERARNQVYQLLSSKSTVIRTRMMETVVEMAVKSDDAHATVESAGFLEPLIKELDTSDILTRFNLIEMLAELGATSSGASFLHRKNVLQRFATAVENRTQTGSLELSAIVKMYGKMGESQRVDFAEWDAQYRILDQLEKLMEGDDDFEPDEPLKIEAMSSFGLIGGNILNLEYVTNSSCAETFSSILASLRRDTKVAWFHTVAQVFSCSVDPTHETERVAHAFYKKLEGQGQSAFIARILAAAKSQAIELSMAALSLMIALSSYPFAVKAMGQHREYMTFLFDRSADLTHAAKVARHETIEGMLKTVRRHSQEEAHGITLPPLLTPDQTSRLNLVYREGPFYQRATATVAIKDLAA
ncbi:26S proteasome non-ATPase regulatory subunit 5 [Actinomortierella wolfii]|nr:26S proteasome non-ATPase regulatory subunit 5 [Actinomortierella wolfii]